MADKNRISQVDAYIKKYYIPRNDDIDVADEEVLSFFERITKFRKKKKQKESDLEEFEVLESKDAVEFDMENATKTKVSVPLNNTLPTNRRIDDLIHQLDETFSRRLLRMIHERDISESDAYKKAYVDRRHFSKIKRDEFYTPNKKTVLAFSIALELSLDETKDLLNSAGYALSRSSKFDIIIVYFLENKIYDMFEINEVLYEYDQPLFE